MATIGQKLTTPETGMKRYDATINHVKLNGFIQNDSTAYIGGTALGGTNPSVGSTMKFDFIGTSLQLFTYCAPDHSASVEIDIDGVKETYSERVGTGTPTLVYQKLNLENKRHSVTIKKIVSDGYVTLDLIDINIEGRLLHPDEVTDPKDLDVGKRIRCHYTAPISGQVGVFSNLGQETYKDGINDFIPPTSSATPNGDFYFIMAEDWNGKKRLIADRNIQHSISWDTLNSSGVASGSGLPIIIDANDTSKIQYTIRLLTGGVSASDLDNEWTRYIVDSTLNGAISTPGDNNVWNWSGIYSWTSTVNTYGSDRRTVRGNSSASNSNWATTNWVTNTCGFRPVLLIESLYTPTVKYLFEDNGEVKKWTSKTETPVIASIVSSAPTYQGSYQNLIDGNNSTQWWSSTSGTFTFDLTLQDPVILTSYSIVGGDKDTDCPESWELYGSQDGINYTLLHLYSGPKIGVFQVKESTFANDVPYKYYRLAISAGSYWLNFSDIIFNESTSQGWKAVGLAPATESMFLNDGMDDLSIIDNNALQQLESDTPKLLMYIDDPNKISASANLTAIPNGQLIFQEGDMDVSGGIESINITGSNIKIIASVDNGTTWKFFDSASWQSIEANAASVKENGMTPEMVNGITKEQWKDLLGDSTTIRFAYYLEQNDITDTVNVDTITITPLPFATETPSLDSVKITYDELSIEGRMQDLERINAINMAKLQFKSNALLHSERYELHDLIIDTFESLDGIDTTNTTAKYDSNNKVFLYDTSIGAPSIQEVVLQEEILPEYRKKWMLYVEDNGNIDYEYSLDGGATWSPINPFTMMDLTQQTGVNLKVKAKLKDSTANLRGIAFSWA